MEVEAEEVLGGTEFEEEWQKYPCIIGRSKQGRKVWTRNFGDPGVLWVLHRCHRYTCRQVKHLYLGTPKQNWQDARMNAEINGAPLGNQTYWQWHHAEVERSRRHRFGRPN